MRFQNAVPLWIIFKERLSGILVCSLVREAPELCISPGEKGEVGEPWGYTHAPINLPEGKQT